MWARGWRSHGGRRELGVVWRKGRAGDHVGEEAGGRVAEGEGRGPVREERAGGRVGEKKTGVVWGRRGLG